MRKSNVIPLKRAAQPLPAPPADMFMVPDDIIDTSEVRMKSLERDLKVENSEASLAEKKEKRAAWAIAVIEFEAYRLSALIGIAPAIEQIQQRVIKRLAEGIQP